MISLSPYQVVMIFHLRDLASNKLRRINCKDVHVFNVQHYEGLSTEDILNF